MAIENLLLIGLGLVFAGLYFLRVTGRFADVKGTPAPLWNASIGVLLVGVGTFGIENTKTFVVTLEGLRVGLETERYKPTPEEETLAIETSADSVAPEQEEQAEALIGEARTREAGERSASDLLVLATNAWRAEGFDTAIDFALQELHLEPSNDRLRATLRHRLASAYAGLGALGVAEKLYREAIAEDPTFSWPHNNLGIALGDQGNLEAAIESYRTAIRLDPDVASAHNNLGVALESSPFLVETLHGS